MEEYKDKELTAPSVAWDKWPSRGYQPEGRVGSIAQRIGGIVFVFGGFVGSRRVQTCIAYDVDKKRWSKVSTSGDPPPPTSYHTSWTMGSQLYIQGGEVDAMEGSSAEGLVSTKGCTDKLFVLDTRTFKWSQVKTRLAPLPRKRHSSTTLYLPQSAAPSLSSKTTDQPTAMVPSVIVFGGIAADSIVPSNELFSIRCDTLGSWSAVWHRPQVNGTPPSPRYGATLTAVSCTKAVLFGGAVDSDMFANDLHLLDTKSMTWSKISATGRPPLGRHSHEAAFIPASKSGRNPSLLVFGGVSCLQSKFSYPYELYLFDLVNGCWSEVPVGPLFPPPRHSFCLVPLYTPPFPVPAEALHTVDDVVTANSAGMASSSSVPAIPVGFSQLSGLARLSADAGTKESTTGGEAPLLGHATHTASAKTVGFRPKPIIHRGAGATADGEFGVLEQRLTLWLYGGQAHQICGTQVWSLAVETGFSAFHLDLVPSRTSMSSLADRMHRAEPEEEVAVAASESLAATSASQLRSNTSEAELGASSSSTLMLSQYGARKEIIRLQSLFDKERSARLDMEKELFSVLHERDDLLLRIKTLERSRQYEIDAVKKECDIKVAKAELKQKQAETDLRRIGHLYSMLEEAYETTTIDHAATNPNAAQPEFSVGTIGGGPSCSVSNVQSPPTMDEDLKGGGSASTYVQCHGAAGLAASEDALALLPHGGIQGRIGFGYLYSAQ